MFGLSLTKLLLLALVVVAVWQGARLYRRINRLKEAMERARRTTAVQDLRACPACGSYVAAEGAQRCGRPDCPVAA